MPKNVIAAPTAIKNKVVLGVSIATVCLVAVAIAVSLIPKPSANYAGSVVLNVTTSPVIDYTTSNCISSSTDNWNLLGKNSIQYSSGGKTLRASDACENIPGIAPITQYGCVVTTTNGVKKSYKAQIKSNCPGGLLCAGGTCASNLVSCVSGQTVGDVNNDGKIDVIDQELIMNMDVGKIKIPKNICCADMYAYIYDSDYTDSNGGSPYFAPDGIVDLGDAILVQRIINGLMMTSTPFAKLPKCK